MRLGRWPTRKKLLEHTMPTPFFQTTNGSTKPSSIHPIVAHAQLFWSIVHELSITSPSSQNHLDVRQKTTKNSLYPLREAPRICLMQKMRRHPTAPSDMIRRPDAFEESFISPVRS
jgi:hypothetical protein